MSTEEKYLPSRKFQLLFLPNLYKSWFDSSFLQLLQDINTKKTSDFIKKETDEVYSFKIFSKKFLIMINEEIENFYATGLEAHRPNSMNNYGVILNDIGMKPMLDVFQRTCIIPIAKVLFPEYSKNIVDHHTFIVKYNANEDVGLDMHTDDSDVTFNVCLGKDFKGSTLSFCGNMGDPAHRKFTHTYQHEIGRGVIHLGNRRHGADDIISGTRINLVMWSKNKIRPEKKEYEKENSKPDDICLSYTHDRDYEKYKKKSIIKFSNRNPWCPPIGKEFDKL